MSLCGPSAQEKAIAGEQATLATTMAGAFNSRFGQQSQVLNNLNQSLTPIVAAGPNQQGFSPEELAAMNTAAINNAGAANRNAQQAAGNAFAGQGGGGTSGIQSGIQSAVKGGIAATEAANLAGTENQIVQNNYATGRSNYEKGVAGMQALSGDYAPESFGQGAESGYGSAFGEAKTINSQNPFSAIANGALSLAGSVAKGFGNLDKTGESTGGEQALNFFTGMGGSQS